MVANTFERYERLAHQHIYKRFKDGNFIVAVRDEATLRQFVKPTALSPVPGYDGVPAFIAKFGEQYSELWLDPSYRSNRALHLRFFESIDVEVPKSILDARASDHAFPRSANEDKVGFTLMNFIDRAVNSSYGGGWEKRQKHRATDEGVGNANLVDLGKAMGHRLDDPHDFQGSIGRLPELLIAAGQAPESDREWLALQVVQALDDWQWQDTNYAINTGQWKP